MIEKEGRLGEDRHPVDMMQNLADVRAPSSVSMVQRLLISNR